MDTHLSVSVVCVPLQVAGEQHRGRHVALDCVSHQFLALLHGFPSLSPIDKLSNHYAGICINFHVYEKHKISTG